MTLDTGVCGSCWQVLSELARPACVTLRRRVVGCWRLSVVMLPGQDESQTDTLAGKPYTSTGTQQPGGMCSQVSTVCMRGVSSDTSRKSRYHWREENKSYGLKANRECTGEEEMMAGGL